MQLTYWLELFSKLLLLLDEGLLDDVLARLVEATQVHVALGAPFQDVSSAALVRVGVRLVAKKRLLVHLKIVQEEALLRDVVLRVERVQGNQSEEVHLARVDHTKDLLRDLLLLLLLELDLRFLDLADVVLLELVRVALHALGDLAESQGALGKRGEPDIDHGVVLAGLEDALLLALLQLG